MNDFDSENYAYINSNCENDMTLNYSIDESSNAVATDDDPQMIFEWNNPEEQESME